ncbi:MAG: tRNA (N(6)-L-threonylcarbamoyladenosine(37)-C(2))-methylthiotransferase MtaB [Armatimonadota bacterium]
MTAARVRILTLGCKVNQCDSDEIARALAARGYEIAGRGEAADTYIVNTCTVTAVADAKAHKLIRRLAREHPEATLIVTGCLAQRDPFSLLDLPGVTAVVPNKRKPRLPDFLPNLVVPLFPTVYSPSRTRSFLKLQDGCDHRCAYCVVPDARGRPVSRPLHEALEEIRRLAEAGVQELVLCGIRLGAYGRERGEPRLALLLRELRDVPIPRLRLSSIEPMDLDPALLDEMSGHPSICHHLHLPLQSGDDEVLRAMGRSYTTADFADLVRRVREAWPDAAISTDAMAGFPGETEEQFERSMAFLRGMAFSRVHVFPYSRRPGTPAAARPDQVPGAVKRERTQKLLALADELAAAAAQAMVGRTVAVLFEQRGSDGVLVGHTPHYIALHAPGPPEWVNRIVELTPERAEAGGLYCR